MTRKIRLAAHLVVLVVLFGMSAVAWAGGEDGNDWVGRPAPDFALSDLDGNPLNFAELKGSKVIWLNFWGLRCGPCVRELPALQKIHEQYASQGLLIIGVNADGVGADFIRAQFEKRDDLKRAGVSFPLAPEEDFSVIDGYELMGAPLNVMIDKQGVIRFRHEGYEDGDEVRYLEIAKQLLSE